MVKQMLFHKATHHGQSPTTVSLFILLRAAIALTLPSSWGKINKVHFEVDLNESSDPKVRVIVYIYKKNREST